MHQTHTLPWNQVAKHIDFVRTHATLTQPLKGELVSRDDEKIVREMSHFVRCFRDSIHTFAKGEIEKLERKNQCSGKGLPLKADPSEPLFADALLDLRDHPFHLDPFDRNNTYANQLTEDHQRLANWVTWADGEDGYYSSANGDLADSVKLLIQLGESEAILRLCRAPPHLKGIMSMGWGHSFGVNHILYETLPRYLLMNIGYAVRQRVIAERMAAADRPIDPITDLPRGMSPKKQFTSLYEIDKMRQLARDSFTSYDFSTQFVMHRIFWEKYMDEKTEEGKVIARYMRNDGDPPYPVPPDPTVTDVGRTKQYLADCFRSLYLVDIILLHQHGSDEKEVNIYWEKEITDALVTVVRGLRTEQYYDDESEQWLTKLV